MNEANITGVFAFTTSNYDAMTRFFRDLGFTVTEDKRNQLVPLFNSGRGADVRGGDIMFNLEESTDGAAVARFNLWLCGFSVEDVARLRGLGYEISSDDSPYGDQHTIRTPDGDLVCLAE